jgi:formylglycine-generating enzyme required for sulfatase activity
MSKLSNRMFRGGGWDDNPFNTRVAFRNFNPHMGRIYYLSFRLKLKHNV